MLQSPAQEYHIYSQGSLQCSPSESLRKDHVCLHKQSDLEEDRCEGYGHNPNKLVLHAMEEGTDVLDRLQSLQTIKHIIRKKIEQRGLHVL